MNKIIKFIHYVIVFFGRFNLDAHGLLVLENNSNIQDFSSGDTVRVNITIKEGEREREQAFQGVVIRKRGNGHGSSFTLRRVSNDVGVERTFLTYSPLIKSLEVVKKGKVRRARLGYLRGLSGKKARIKEGS
ncbi:MAG: 50S ribosomal protein L19 [Chloroflexi bacterium]|nr:50S ribosomal protein L19 [Chloroflexota bacterium]|tara:strand:+ start:58704 stop:59099 length:396 start_codon:yes stop_codon:yes gene_type:complete